MVTRPKRPSAPPRSARPEAISCSCRVVTLPPQSPYLRPMRGESEGAGAAGAAGASTSGAGLSVGASGAGAGAGAGALPESRRAAVVSSTMPEAVRPKALWTLRRAASVPEPKMPSAPPAGSWPREIRSRWSCTTASPRAPRVRPTMGESTRPRAVAVPSSTEEVSGSPTERWKAFTAARVIGPKAPSAPPTTSTPWARRARWRATTASPREPTERPVTATSTSAALTADGRTMTGDAARPKARPSPATRARCRGEGSEGRRVNMLVSCVRVQEFLRHRMPST